MKIPGPMLKFLKSKGIKEPTPIQAQGIPVACVPLPLPLSLSLSILHST